MDDTKTTMVLKKSTLKKLEKLKIHPRQSLEEVLELLLSRQKISFN